jgi:hypothetical protein
MRYLLYTTPDPTGTSAPPSPELMAEMSQLVEQGFRDGTLVATGAMDPHVTRIEHSQGTFTLTDGPFTEAKEAVVGWALVDVKSKDEAIELSKKFWRLVGDGSGIIQRVFDPGEQPSAADIEGALSGTRG